MLVALLGKVDLEGVPPVQPPGSGVCHLIPPTRGEIKKMS